MTKPVAAPEIFQIPLDQIEPTIVPPGIKPGSPEFEQAVIMHYALRYAEKGWQAMVTVNDGFVRVLAIPQQGMDPKDYVQGLLQNGFLEDALPILQALDGMIEDAEIAYNLGICFSELGQTAESVEPLERCTRLAPNYTNAWVGLGVAYTRLGRITEAMRALQKAVALEPNNPFAQRNLGALLSKEGKQDEALPHFRQAVKQAPNDPAAAFGLGQCLQALGGEHRKEADQIYSDLIKRHADSPVADMARQALTQLAQDSFRDNVDGAVRMDAVFYMMDALDRFAGMSKADIGQVTMEVALLGRQGLRINDPDTRYTLSSMEGDFSALNLLCLMHAGVRSFDPQCRHRHRPGQGIRHSQSHACEQAMSALPEAYLKLVLPLIDKARGFLENGESLQPFAFVGSAASGEMLPVMIDTQTAESKDNSALLIKTAAEQTQADFIFTVMEAWGLPRDKMPRYQEILDKYGSVGASPYKIDTAAFVVETRYGVWGTQVPLKPKGYSKKKRTFGPVELQFMDGVEGRFVGLLPEAEKQNLH